MARTTQMKLLELLVLKQDIYNVIEFIGKKESFQFQRRLNEKKEHNIDLAPEVVNIDSQLFEQLNHLCVELEIKNFPQSLKDVCAPQEDDRSLAKKIILLYKDLSTRIANTIEELNKTSDAYKEALAFANLQLSYSELEHLSFLTLRIGKLPPENFSLLKQNLEGSAIVIPLGEDKSHIMVASSKKGSVAIESELKSHNFVEMQVPQGFKGVPENVLQGFTSKIADLEREIKNLKEEKKNFTETHKSLIIELISKFAVGVQIEQMTSELESTDLVYRITGWITSDDLESYMQGLDSLTQGRIAIRQYEPLEVPSVISGKEQVPVKLTHGKFVKSFERMIFSYGSPLYGTVDPTPFVAVFFTILFGIMFGDFGQGLVFIIMGILMAKNIIKVGGWNKFALVFLAIGISSSLMGLLTGEFFGTETLLEPFSLWITGLFGNPRSPILKLMPSSDPKSVYVMFGVFGVAVAMGFVINTVGLIINMINNCIRKKYAHALFGKNGLAGAIFFWYAIALVLRIVILHHSVAIYDFVILGISLFFAAFAEPFERKMNGETKLFENGFGTYIISGIVELIEVISGYLSNTVSFVRVGAFALSHAVLNFTILTLTELCGGQFTPLGILVLIAGNALIIVLEGMIVAIQVIRLQYYEFFSKFFHETGREFTPFKFEIK